MVRCRPALSMAICFVVSSGSAMDQPDFVLKSSIKKVISIAKVRGITFCGNKEVLINRWASGEECCKVIDLSNNQCTDLLAQTDGKPFRFLTTQSLTYDNYKKRVLLYDDRCDVLVYDSETKKTYGTRLSESNACHPVAFGCSPNTILFETRSRSISSYNYDDHSIVVEEKLADLLKNNDGFYVTDYLPTQKILLFSGLLADRGAYLYDCVENKLKCLMKTHPGYLGCSFDESFVVYHHGPYHSRERCLQDICDRNGCYILHLHHNQLIALDHKNDPCCSVVIHPSNKFVTTLSTVEKVIQYFSAQTGRLIGQQYSPTPEKEKICSKTPAGHSNQDCLSFSPDGTMLAVAFPTQCVIYNVPFKVFYEVGEKKQFALILWALQNYDDGLLPNDVVRLLMNKIMEISRL